jgi:hypothetical protein
MFVAEIGQYLAELMVAARITAIDDGIGKLIVTRLTSLLCLMRQ